MAGKNKLINYGVVWWKLFLVTDLSGNKLKEL